VQVEQYINGEHDVPLLISGSSGSGKSSVLAAAVNRLQKWVRFLMLFRCCLLMLCWYIKLGFLSKHFWFISIDTVHRLHCDRWWISQFPSSRY